MRRHLSELNTCPVCHSFAKNVLLTLSGADVYRTTCCRCGVFRITAAFSAVLNGPLRDSDFTPDRIANFSSYIHENQNQLYSEADIDLVLQIRTPPVSEKAAKLMRFIARQHPYAGQQFEIPWIHAQRALNIVDENKEGTLPDNPALADMCTRLFPYIAASWSRNADEFLFLLNTYLRHTQGFLEEGSTSRSLKLTPAGWNYLQALEAHIADSTTAFVAMWFDPGTDPLWTAAIRPAVYDSGYEPVRIDIVEHTNRIDDEIIARIRASKFIVADFTGQRGGVYFESGFAMGLGKRVIWCVNDAEIKDIHFDNRQFNFLRWLDSDLPAFRRALANRIEAIFGKGPIKLDSPK